MKTLVRRKTIIKEFAKELARLQKKADEWFYLKNNQNHADWILTKVDGIKGLAVSLNICEEVYKEAYKIYDFRNSGREGYTLKDGVIVQVGETKEKVNMQTLDCRLPNKNNI